MEIIAWLWDFAVHLDAHLATIVADYGAWIYALLFLIVFCETGLVVTPFLPGDSLLFVVGALAAVGDMNLGLVMLVLVSAALCGDNVNYLAGRWFGPKVFRAQEARWLNHKHLERAQAFYERHGGKTIVIARFVPIMRTFAPFIAGIGRMYYPRYIAFCVGGALLWVGSLCVAGYFFGNIPFVRQNLTAVIMGIIVLSVMPVVFSWWGTREARR